MTRSLPLVVALAAMALGCTGDLQLRVENPVGATLRIDAEEPQELRIPASRTILGAARGVPYPVVLEIPAAMASRYGGVGHVRLRGTLRVFPPTRVAAMQRHVVLPIEDDDLRALITGEVATISTWVHDPNESGRGNVRYLARLQLSYNR